MSGPARIELVSGRLDLELAPEIGGAIAAFRLRRPGGRQALMREAPAHLTDALDAAAFPLVPFSNRIRDGRFRFRGREVELSPNLPGQKHPLHGQGWRRPWRVVSAGRDRAVLEFDHPPGEWPWAYRARQSFALGPTGLDYRIEVTNLDATAMPAGLGLHPYFPCDGATVLSARVGRVWTIDGEIMPVEVRPAAGRYSLDGRRICGQDLDNGFGGWDGRAAIRWADGAGLDLISPACRYFQLYSPAGGGLFVAEPVSHANDALDHPETEARALGVRVLEPGETLALAARFEVRI